MLSQDLNLHDTSVYIYNIYIYILYIYIYIYVYIYIYIRSEDGVVWLWRSLVNIYILYQGFISRTLMTHKTAREVRGPSFIPLYHFHPLTNIQTFILQLCTRQLSRISNRTGSVYQADTRWDYHLIALLFNWSMMWYWFLFVYSLIWLKVFITVTWHWKPVESNSQRLLVLHYKQTD